MAGWYDTQFFDSITAGSRRSAEIVLGRLAPLFEESEERAGPLPLSLVDIGCGTGTWARVFAERFAGAEVRGVDGAYLDPARLVIPADRFRAHDLTLPLPADRRFGLAMSLEVGEHLPAAAAPVLVRTLVDHADHVLFSAAVPGQGGEYHVNEQPLEYWRALFAEAGYVPVDCLRPALTRDRRVEPWYRYNSLLYVRATALEALPEAFRAAVVPEDRPLADWRSPLWRLRCAFLQRLPAAWVLGLARLKRRVLHGLVLRGRPA